MTIASMMPSELNRISRSAEETGPCGLSTPSEQPESATAPITPASGRKPGFTKARKSVARDLVAVVSFRPGPNWSAMVFWHIMLLQVHSKRVRRDMAAAIGFRVWDWHVPEDAGLYGAA